MRVGRTGGEPRRAGVYLPGVNGRGGAGRLAVLLALEIARGGWATTVFTDGSVQPDELARDLGVDLSQLEFVALAGQDPRDGSLRRLRRLRTTWRHARQIRRLDLGLFVNVRFKSDLPGCGRRNVYYCMFPHRLQVESAGRAHALYLWAASAVERALVVRHRGGFLATYDEVWAISEFTARHVEERWGRRPLLVYPACEPVPRGVKQRVIAVVGRFQAPGPNIPYKAQDVLLSVFATLTDLHAQGWRLVMVGGTSPEGSAYLSGLRELAQGLPVTFVTDGSREQVRDILGEASLYWHAQGVAGDGERFPESQEHFGISTVEAMSAAAIPLVYGTAGPAEVVGGVPGVSCWKEPDELAELTRSWARASDEESEAVRQRCQDRAAEFDDAHFRRRVQELV